MRPQLGGDGGQTGRKQIPRWVRGQGLWSEYPKRAGLCSQYPEGPCSQYPKRRLSFTAPRVTVFTAPRREGLCSQHPKGLRSQHPKDCVHSTQKRGPVHTAPERERLPAPSQELHSLVLTGVDELHQDELLHVLVENVLQRPAPLLP